MHQPAGGQQAARRSTTEPKDKAKLTEDANAASLGSKKILAYLQDPFFYHYSPRQQEQHQVIPAAILPTGWPSHEIPLREQLVIDKPSLHLTS
jgi:hypothetical protein